MLNIVENKSIVWPLLEVVSASLEKHKIFLMVNFTVMLLLWMFGYDMRFYDLAKSPYIHNITLQSPRQLWAAAIQASVNNSAVSCDNNWQILCLPT